MLQSREQRHFKGGIMRTDKSRVFYGFLGGVITLALLGGCGKKEQNVVVPGGSAKVTQQGSTTTVEVSSQGEKLKVTASDKGVALPDKFPADVPIMPGATIKMAASSGDGLTVNFSVAASQADALKYYQDNLKAKGWEIEATMAMGDAAMLSAKKDKRECVVNVAKDGSGSMVQLMAPL
jgi:hypothetical protein